MAVTRADVARRAGTSPALVSYVLNGGPRNVAPATRERIEAAIEELGYRPNAVARSLRTARGHSLGLILPDSANLFFAELSQAVEETAREHGFPLLVGNASDLPEREIGYLRAFLDRQVEGIMTIPTGESEELVAEYATVRTPLVMIDRAVDGARFTSVVADAVAGSRVAVEHLVEHGHRAIACLCGPPLSTSRDRVEGYRLALRDAGLEPAGIVERPFGGAAGYEALAELMAHPARPTALFVTSDLAAMGVLRAAFDLGLRVPDDLAVISFDGTAYAAYTRPGLSTVAQPVRDMGRRAAELVIGALKGEPVEPGVQALATTLVRRGSCGCSDTFLPPPVSPAL